MKDFETRPMPCSGSWYASPLLGSNENAERFLRLWASSSSRLVDRSLSFRMET